jgi:hypothetical protein
VHDRDRAVELPDRVREDRHAGDEDPPAGRVACGARHLCRDDPRHPDLPCDLSRALVGRFGVEPEPDDDEDGEWQQEHEQSVGERAGEEAAADLRVSLDRRERDVDRPVPRTCLLDLLPEDADALGGREDAPGDRPAGDDLRLRRRAGRWLGRLGHGAMLRRRIR